MKRGFLLLVILLLVLIFPELGKADTRVKVFIGFGIAPVIVSPVPYPAPIIHCAPGYYIYEYRQRWVPGRCERVWVPSEYRGKGRHFPDRHRTRVRVIDGHYETCCTRGYYVTEEVPVWVPGDCDD